MEELVLRDLVMVDAGEGFAVYTAELDGTLCVVADSGTLSDFFPDDDERLWVEVFLFESADARAAFLRSRA